MRKTIGLGASVMSAEDLRRGRPHLSWMVLPFLLAGMTSESLAAPAGREVNSIRIRYDRTELNSAASARNLLTRIGHAARESCGASSFSLSEFKAATERSPCWKAAVDDAVRSIGSPLLNAAAERGR